jgi:hypothetical protein
MYKYKYTEQDEDLVEDFIERAIQSHMRERRSVSELKEDIRIGKLGEIAYWNYANPDCGEIDWSGRPQDQGADFTHTDGTKIQVKTIRSDAKWASFYNWNFDRLVVFKEDNGILTLLKDLEVEEVRSISRKSNWKGWYIDPFC